MMPSLFAMLLLTACGGAEVASDAAGNAAIGGEAAPVASSAPTPAEPVEAAPRSPAAPAADTLDAFWTRFRSAALANDVAAIRALSAPVVEQHGELDDSPVAQLTPAQVPGVLAKILERADGVDDAGRTQRALLEAALRPPADSERPADSYRFGDMEFERGADGWRLVRVYYEEG